jgi:hypothetical protein
VHKARVRYRLRARLRARVSPRVRLRARLRARLSPSPKLIRRVRARVSPRVRARLIGPRTAGLSALAAGGRLDGCTIWIVRCSLNIAAQLTSDLSQVSADVIMQAV